MPNAKPNITLLGFDFGMKRIGVAVGQTLTKSATPLTTLKANRGQPNWSTILNLIHTWHADALVVGIPYNMDGSSQPMTQLALRFAKQLGEHSQKQVYTIDERLTTVEAKQQLYDQGELTRFAPKEQLDSYAAKLILEQWLQTKAPS